MEWTKYTTKEALKDNDELMILDKDANANKRTLMDKIWDYVVDKMTTAVIAKLGTTNKTLIGAVNELNSKSLYTYMLPIDSHVDIKLPCADGCYILTINHAWAGNNIYITQGNLHSESIGIYPIRKDYEKFIVTAKGIDTLSVSQKDTGGNSEVGLLRLC